MVIQYYNRHIELRCVNILVLLTLGVLLVVLPPYLVLHCWIGNLKSGNGSTPSDFKSCLFCVSYKL